MYIELASGYAPADGFVHVDINKHVPDLDVCCSVDALPFKDGSVDEIRAVDILEHLSYRDTAAVLAEWARVLAPGGTMFIQTPDAETMIHWHLGNRLRDSTPPELQDLPSMVWLAWRIMGGHADDIRVKDDADFRWNAHYAMFSMSSLQWYVERAGLRVTSLTRNPFPNLFCHAEKP